MSSVTPLVVFVIQLTAAVGQQPSTNIWLEAKITSVTSTRLMEYERLSDNYPYFPWEPMSHQK
jgi:hypothetical protein